MAILMSHRYVSITPEVHTIEQIKLLDFGEECCINMLNNELSTHFVENTVTSILHFPFFLFTQCQTNL